MVPKSKQIGLWIAWFCIWPASLTLVYFHWPRQFVDDPLDIFSFGLIMCIVAFFPLIVNKTPIFFVHGIGFAVFLNYGLFVEILLTQFALLVVLFRVRVGRKDLYRIPLNMLMFLFVSTMAAYVYLLLGGEIGSIYLLSPDKLIPVAGYVLTVFVSNHILLYGLRRLLFEQKPKLIDKSLVWEFFTTVVVLPVGFVLYMMYQDFGIFGIYFVGIPFISISIILMLYHSSNSINYYLQQTSEIGHQLTAELEVNEVIDLFVERIAKLLPVDYAFVYDVVDDDHLQLIRFYDAEHKLDFPKKDRLMKNESISGTAWATNKVIHYHAKKDWKHLKDVYLPLQGESVISLPIERKNKIVAVITLLSTKKRAFEKSQYMILDILKNHLAVALENARNYEETKNKSERDQLTDLYNYRYFEDFLENYFYEMKQANRQEDISLILLDLDRFKTINDTYGHQSGNEILIGLAGLLRELVNEEGIIARYGGEEFIILLPGFNQLQSLNLAETIRKEIESKSFTLVQHILVDDHPVDIHVTASLGVATYPDNCEDPLDLIRHADRAMYVGAKQRGRNKVAVYEN